MAGTVLSFELSQKENELLKGLCGMTGLRLREISPAEYGETVGALAGVCAGTGAAGQGKPLAGQMLVFADVPDQMLDMVLSMIRTLGIAVGSYKAVLTEMNAQWPVPVLFAELQREREEIEKQK